MRPGARSRSLERCFGCIEVQKAGGGDTMWETTPPIWRRLREACRIRLKPQIANLRASQQHEATFGAAWPIEKRLALKGSVPRLGGIRWCALTRKETARQFYS